MITENKIENESEVDNSNLNYDSKRNMNPFEFSEELNTETVTVNKENNIQRNLTEIMMTEEATTFSEKIMENPMKSRKENNQVINPKISFDMVTENQKILSESESESESKLKSKFETENEFIPETDDEKKIKKNEDKITIHTTESIKKRKDNNEYKEAYYNNATEIETIRKNQILEEEKEKENEKEKNKDSKEFSNNMNPNIIPEEEEPIKETNNTKEIEKIIEKKIDYFKEKDHEHDHDNNHNNMAKIEIPFEKNQIQNTAFVDIDNISEIAIEIKKEINVTNTSSDTATASNAAPIT
jgi:hypothetical protein